MSTFIGGEVKKMYIEGFKDDLFENKVNVDGEDRFTLMVNPESISRKVILNYADSNTLNTDQSGKYSSSNAEELNLSILLDTTGVIKDADLISFAITNPFSNEQVEDVSVLVVKLYRFCCEIDGETHRPHYVKVCWGSASGLFKGVVTSFDINYKLFRPDGKPIRAIVNLSLRSTVNAEQFVKQIGFESPDITHKRVFSAGEHFTLLSNRIYNNTGYYIDVAKANKMLGFRKIEQGTALYFPPVK